MMKEHHSQPAFHKVAGILQRRWKMIAGVSLLGAAATGAIGFVLPPRYTAKAQLVVELPAANVPSALDDAAIETRVELLLSEEHLRRVYVSLGGNFDEPSKDARDMGLFWWWSQPANASGLPGFDSLQRNINAYKERKSRVIGVTYTDNDPQFAARVANQTAELYLVSVAERRRTERDEQLKALDLQVPLARAEVERAEAALQAFRTSSGVAVSKRADISAEEIAELTRQLSLAKSELDVRRAKVKSLSDFIRTGDAAPDLIDSLQDPALTDLIREDDAMRALFAPTAGRAQEADSLSRINDLRSRIGLSANRHLATWAEEADNIGMRVRLLEARLDMVRAASSAGRDAELRMSEMQREATASAQLFEGLLQKQKDLRSSAANPPDIRVASVASLPQRPSSPHPLLFVLPGMFLAGVLASFVTILRDRLDTSMRSQQDVAARLGVPCIGLVPLVKGFKRNRPFRIAIEYPFAQFTEALRSIVLSLHRSPTGHTGAQLVIVTSSVKGEGKTTLATSLATSAAVLGRRVLLVDLDFRNPGLCQMLGVQSERGLLDVLDGQPAAACIYRMEDEKIDVLGLPLDSAMMAPASAREGLIDVLRKIGADYDLVIADAGALLQSAEVNLIVTQADLAMFAVRWGVTRQDVARHALRQISSAPIVAVLTQVNLKKHAKYRFGDVGEILSRMPARGPRAANI